MFDGLEILEITHRPRNHAGNHCYVFVHLSCLQRSRIWLVAAFEANVLSAENETWLRRKNLRLAFRPP